MRSGIHGTFATLLLMVPVLSIPALAIFGIPQFAPVVASPLDEGPGPDRERGTGQSARHSNDGMLDDLSEAPAFGSEPTDRDETAPRGRVGDSVPLQRPGQGLAEKRFGSGQNVPRNQPPARRQPDEFDVGKSHQGLGGMPNRYADRGDPGTLDSARPTVRPQPGDANERQGGYLRSRDELPETSKIRPAIDETEALTWQGAVRRLNELEIRNFRLQPGHRDNQFIFICSYTPSDSPRVSYRFEAEADEPLKAVEKVLEQIVEWQQRRQDGSLSKLTDSFTR